jgi:polyhydroxybutyrate depolymerase
MSGKRVDTRERPPSPGRYVRRLRVDGLYRHYILDVPEGVQGTTPMPLILGFHGGGATPQGFAGVTKLSETAGRNGIITAYPAGYKRSWNGGDTGGPARREGIDDVRFVRILLDNLSSILSIDQRRVFATGWSNGGKLAFRLACEMSEQIAAVAVVGSGLGVECSPVRPVPVLMFHGTADTFCPYEGGEGTDPVARGISQSGAQKTFQRWVRLNGCEGPPEVTYHNGAAKAITYTDCHDGATVTLCTIEKMGHQWPGCTIPDTTPGLSSWLKRLGPGTDDVDATTMIVSFFLKHSISPSS